MWLGGSMNTPGSLGSLVPFILAVLLKICKCPVTNALIPAAPATPKRSSLGGVGPPAKNGGGREVPNKPLGCASREMDQYSPEALCPPVLELITPDGCASLEDPSRLLIVESVRRAVAGGVSLVQFRDYKSDAAKKAGLAPQLRAATGGRAWFVVNGEPDIARAYGADGVHLPERMMSRLVGLRDAGEWPRVVGCSVHSVAAAIKAARLGADYIQVGTMFATPSHPGKEPEGVALLTDVRRALEAKGFRGVLVIGVGGIDASNCGVVAAVGGDGVAAIRCLCEGSDAEEEARRMISAFKGDTEASPGCAQP